MIGRITRTVLVIGLIAVASAISYSYGHAEARQMTVRSQTTTDDALVELEGCIGILEQTAGFLSLNTSP